MLKTAIKVVILAALVIAAVWMKSAFFTENTGFDRTSDFGMFRVESAMRYHYAKLFRRGSPSRRSMRTRSTRKA